MSKLKDILDTAKGFTPANIVKGVAKETIGNVIGSAKDVITNIQNNKLTVEQGLQELEKIKIEAEQVSGQQISERWKADMNSDSWLSKNVRPLVLIYMVVCTTLLVFIDAGVLTFDVKSSWIDEAEYKKVQNKSGKDYYLLYDYTSDRFARDIEEKPLDIDFKRNLIKTLYPSTTENITTYYGDEAQTIKVVEEHHYSSYSEIYWYKISGKDIVPKTYKKSK